MSLNFRFATGHRVPLVIARARTFFSLQASSQGLIFCFLSAHNISGKQSRHRALLMLLSPTLNVKWGVDLDPFQCLCASVCVCVLEEGEFNHHRDIHTQVCNNLVHIQGTFYSPSAHRIKRLYSQSKVLSVETKMNFIHLLGLDIVKKL